MQTPTPSTAASSVTPPEHPEKPKVLESCEWRSSERPLEPPMLPADLAAGVKGIEPPKASPTGVSGVEVVDPASQDSVIPVVDPQDQRKLVEARLIQLM